MNDELSGQGFYINPDVILRVIDFSWIISNPRLRSHVGLDEQAVAVFTETATKMHTTKEQWLLKLKSAKGRDCTQRGIGSEGLVADHSGYTMSKNSNWFLGEQLFELLCKKRILIKDRENAMEPIRELTGVLDNESLGTFHQRVGQYTLLERRAKEPWREWQNQKFSKDGKSLLDTMYKKIQEPFFDKQFSAQRVKELNILDFGCGNAYYTAKFAERGAFVTGLDNSEELLDIARANYVDKSNLKLILTSSFEETLELMTSWASDSIDLIYLQDTLLLLLQPEVGKASPLLPELFNEFRRLIKPQGLICAMEPNPVFWLASRYGDPLQPYAIVSEYRHPTFNVAPTLDQLLPNMAKAGFALKKILHPSPESNNLKDNNGFQFEFPIWDYYEFTPI